MTNDWWKTLEGETAMDRETIEAEAKRIIERLVGLNASLLDTLDIAVIVMSHAVGGFNSPSNIKKAAYGARHAITLNEQLALREYKQRRY